MKRKLNRLINLISSALILLSFLIAFFLFYHHLQTSFELKIQQQTQKLADYINHGYTLSDKDKALFSERVTLIDQDGTVLFDSTSDNLNNHLDRDEIQAAFKTNTGSSRRLSSTLNQQLYYYAVKLDDGSILRLSDSMDSIWSFSFEFAIFIILLMITVFTLSFFLVKRLVSRFIDPINQIDFDQPLTYLPYVELEPLLVKLEAHNQMRKEFSANVSHELKTPLQSIMGYSELILNDMANPEDIKAFNHKIYQEATRLYGMIEDIIALAKLDEKKILSEFEPIDYKQLIEQVILKLAPLSKKNNITIQTHLKPVQGMGIPSIIEETFINLISNAIKYHGDHPKIWVTLSENHDSVYIIIKDNGIGISEQDLPRIFERFFRADKSHNQAIEGSGLGLAIVKHSIQLLQGSIDVQSRLHHGTTFKVTLPKRRSY